jgi:hypothetical protein
MKKKLLIFLIIFFIQNSLLSDRKYRSKDNLFGCTNKNTHETVVSYAINSDFSIFRSLFYNLLVTKECVIFNEGEILKIISKNENENIVQVIRMNGFKYWTDISNLSIY